MSSLLPQIPCLFHLFPGEEAVCWIWVGKFLDSSGQGGCLPGRPQRNVLELPFFLEAQREIFWTTRCSSVLLRLHHTIAPGSTIYLVRKKQDVAQTPWLACSMSANCSSSSRTIALNYLEVEAAGLRVKSVPHGQHVRRVGSQNQRFHDWESWKDQRAWVDVLLSCPTQFHRQPERCVIRRKNILKCRWTDCVIDQPVSLRWNLSRMMSFK